MMVLKKVITIAMAVIFVGVIVYGSGSIIQVNASSLQTAKKYGIIQVGMENNASFLAPMPISFNLNQMSLEKSPYGQTFPECYLLKPYLITKC